MESTKSRAKRLTSFTDNKLTKEIESSLKQGTKVCFTWYGNSELEYVGRIEVNEFGNLFFVNEHFYQNDVLVQESMRFYCPLEGFFFFTKFEVLS